MQLIFLGMPIVVDQRVFSLHAHGSEVFAGCVFRAVVNEMTAPKVALVVCCMLAGQASWAWASDEDYTIFDLWAEIYWFS